MLSFKLLVGVSMRSPHCGRCPSIASARFVVMRLCRGRAVLLASGGNAAIASCGAHYRAAEAILLEQSPGAKRPVLIRRPRFGHSGVLGARSEARQPIAWVTPPAGIFHIGFGRLLARLAARLSSPPPLVRPAYLCLAAPHTTMVGSHSRHPMALDTALGYMWTTHGVAHTAHHTQCCVAGCCFNVGFARCALCQA